MDDVLGEVVLAPGDEDLLPEDPVRAVSLRLGPGAQGPDIGAGVGFGEAHGPAPDAGYEVAQVGRLLFG